MQKITYICLFLLLSCGLYSQKETNKKLEHGFLFSSSLHSNNDFSFNSKGYGIGAGVYYLKRFGKKHAISLDVRLVYTKDDSNYPTSIDTIHDSPSSDTYTTLRYFGIEHKAIAFSFPIKYRYQISEQVPIILLMGINPYFNIGIGGGTYQYFSRREHDIISNEVILTSYHGEILKQKPLGGDIFLVGVGYRSNKWLFDAYLSKGSISFYDTLVEWDRFSILLNVYYRFN